VNIDSSIFGDNKAIEYGGAIDAAGTITVTNSHFENNSSSDAGGAVSSQQGGTIATSSFVLNQAQRGSAFFSDPGGSIEIDRSTFSANTATATATVDVNNTAAAISSSTFYGNTGGNGASGIYSTGGQIATVESSIFSKNTLNNAVNAVFLGTASHGFNLFENALGITTTATDIVGLSAQLEALSGADDGVLKVHNLALGSPAVNAGKIVAGSSTDAQGNPLDPLTDIGAVEFQGHTDTVFWVDDSGKIWRSNTDLSNPIMILDVNEAAHTNGNTPMNVIGIAVDLDGTDADGSGKLYWVDQGIDDAEGTVYYTSLDGLSPSTSILSVFGPTSIAIDSDQNRIFVASSASAGFPASIRIWSVEGATSSFVTAYSSERPGIFNPLDIHFSQATGRLYWTNGNTDTENTTINTMLADGTDYVLLYTSTSNSANFNSIVTDSKGEYLFWTDTSSNTIHRFNLATGLVEVTQSTAPNNAPTDVTFLTHSSTAIWSSEATNSVQAAAENLSTLNQSSHIGTDAVNELAGASFSDPSDVAFVVSDLAYVENSGPRIVTSTNLAVENPNNGTLTPTFTIVTGPTENGTLFLSGTELTASDTFTLEDLNNGEVTYQNDNVIDVTTDIIQLQLTNGVSTTPVKAFSISLTNENDAPKLSAPSTAIVINENSDYSLNASDLVYECWKNQDQHRRSKHHQSNYR